MSSPRLKQETDQEFAIRRNRELQAAGAKQESEVVAPVAATAMSVGGPVAAEVDAPNEGLTLVESAPNAAVTQPINSDLRFAIRREIMEGFALLTPGTMLRLESAPQFQVWKDKNEDIGVNGTNGHLRCSDLRRAGQFAVECADWLIEQMGAFVVDDRETLLANAKKSEAFLTEYGWKRGVSVMAGVKSETIWHHPEPGMSDMMVAVRYGNRQVPV